MEPKTNNHLVIEGAGGLLVPLNDTDTILNLKHFPKRSTLSDANKNRSSEVFANIHYSLFDRYRLFLSDSSQLEVFIKSKWLFITVDR